MPNTDTTYGVHNKQTKEIKIHVTSDDSLVVQSFSGNVETAKAAILTADALANNDTNATQLEYAITADGNGLKFTIAFGTKGSGTAESDDWADTWTTTKAALIAAKNYVKIEAHTEDNNDDPFVQHTWKATDATPHLF